MLPPAVLPLTVPGEQPYNDNESVKKFQVPGQKRGNNGTRGCFIHHQ